jgi:hypothetical protein
MLRTRSRVVVQTVFWIEGGGAVETSSAIECNPVGFISGWFLDRPFCGHQHLDHPQSARNMLLQK